MKSFYNENCLKLCFSYWSSHLNDSNGYSKVSGFIAEKKESTWGKEILGEFVKSAAPKQFSPESFSIREISRKICETEITCPERPYNSEISAWESNPQVSCKTYENVEITFEIRGNWAQFHEILKATEPKNARRRSERPRERPEKDKSRRPEGKFELWRREIVRSVLEKSWGQRATGPFVCELI